MGMTYFGATEHGLARFARYAHGSCAEYIKVPEENVEPLSDRVPFDVACKFGVLGTGSREVRRYNEVEVDAMTILASELSTRRSSSPSRRACSSQSNPVALKSAAIDVPSASPR